MLIILNFEECSKKIFHKRGDVGLLYFLVEELLKIKWTLPLFLRIRLYWQGTCVRFADVSYISRVVRHDAVLADIDADAYGVNPREPFFLFERT